MLSPISTSSGQSTGLALRNRGRLASSTANRISSIRGGSSWLWAVGTKTISSSPIWTWKKSRKSETFGNSIATDDLRPTAPSPPHNIVLEGARDQKCDTDFPIEAQPYHRGHEFILA